MGYDQYFKNARSTQQPFSVPRSELNFCYAPRMAIAQVKFSPLLRSSGHLGAMLLAFPLTWLATFQYGWVWASGICLALAAFNLAVLPKTELGQQVRRENESSVSGVWTYFFALALAFLIFPVYAVGAGWAALAAGDAAATTFGSRIGGPKLPWNPKKSWVGTFAFVMGAAPACCLLLWWACAPQFMTHSGRPEVSFVWTLAMLGAVAGAAIESLDGPLDDNLRVPLGTSLAVWGAAIFLSFGTRELPPGREIQAQWLVHAAIVNTVLAVGLAIVGSVSWPGAAIGFVLGTLAYFFTQPPGYALLVVFVVGGSLLSRVGRKKKEERNAAEADGGRRGAANAAANLLVPVLACLAYPLCKGHPAALLAFAGALCAAFADTASSEIGALANKEPYLITSFKPVPHGTNGAVSVLGYAAALGACLLMVGMAWAGGFWRIVEIGNTDHGYFPTFFHGLLFSWVTIGAGLIGTTVDSVLGALVEDKVPGCGKSAVNFFCTLSGALVAGLAAFVLVLAGLI